MKLVKINSEIHDYGACAFNSCPLTIKDVARELKYRDDGDFPEYEFSAEIIEFDAELSDQDIKRLNALVDTHFEEFYRIT